MTIKILNKETRAEVGPDDLILVDHDGTEKPLNVADRVQQARVASSEAADYRKKLKIAEEQLEKYKDEGGVLLDHELVQAAVKKGKKAGEEKSAAEAQLQAAQDKWAEKTKELEDKIKTLKGESKKAALLSATPLHGTIYHAMGAQHLLVEFGGMLDDDGHPVDRAGKPIMSDANPSQPATIEEAAKVWIQTHPQGADKILLDSYKGGAGETAGKSGKTDQIKGDGYLNLVTSAKK